MDNKKKQFLLSIGLVLVLVLMIVGVSYAAFTFIGTGKRENSITTGVITMSYTESDNIISMNGALPTTDATGKKRLTAGEYFDFTVSSNIKGNTTVNWEIATEDVTSSTAKKIDGKYIKLYLTKINSDGTEEEVMAPKVYTTKSANNYTGRPSGMMSLAVGTTNEAFNNKYRLRMYVDESYNPQGDGGDLSFSVKVNVYGKVTTDAMPTGGTLKAYMMPEDTDMPETDFHTNEYREKVTSIVTKNDNTVPSTAITSYDVSEEQNKSVMAYLEDDGTGAGTYKLTIGGKAGIIASESMKNYFYGFKNIKALDLSNIDTSFTTDMGGMLNNCTNLKDVNLSNFDFSNITIMSGLLFSNDMSDGLKVNMSNSNFAGLKNNSFITPLILYIQELNLSGANFTGVDMSNMFTPNDDSITNIKLDGINTTGVTDMSNMFINCSKLTSLDLSSFDTSKVVNISGMFNGCSNLTSINLKGWNTSQVTNMSNMFIGCNNLISLDLSNFDTSKVTNMDNMFNISSLTLTDLNLNGFDFSSLTTARLGLLECTNLKMSMVGTNFKGLSSNIISSVLSSGVSEIDLTNSDFTNANMTYAFQNSDIKKVNLTDANFRNATMSSMFAGNNGITSINFTNVNTTGVTNMRGMFALCTSLTTLNLSSFDTSQVTDMSSMFISTSKLTNITVGKKWVIDSSANTKDMFGGCGTDHVTTI